MKYIKISGAWIITILWISMLNGIKTLDICLVEEISLGLFKQHETRQVLHWTGTYHITETRFYAVKIGTWISEGERLLVSCEVPYTFQGGQEYDVQVDCLEGRWNPTPVCLLPGIYYEEKKEMKNKARTDNPTVITSTASSIATISSKQPSLPSINATIDVESSNAIALEQKQKEECYCLYEGSDDLVAYSGHELLKAGSRVKANASVKFHCAHFGYHLLMGPREITCQNCKPWHWSEYPDCEIPESGDVIIQVDENQKILPGGTVAIDEGVDAQFICISHGIADYPEWFSTANGQLISHTARNQSTVQDIFFNTLSIHNASSKHDGYYKCFLPGKRERKIQLRVRNGTLEEMKNEGRTGNYTRITSTANSIGTKPNKPSSSSNNKTIETPKTTVSEQKQNEECFCLYEGSDDLVAYSGDELLKAGSRVKANASVKFHCARFGYHHLKGSGEITCQNCKPWRRSEYPKCERPENGDVIILFYENQKILPGGIVTIEEGALSQFCCISHGMVNYPKWSATSDEYLFTDEARYLSNGQDIFFNTLTIIRARSKHDGYYTCSLPGKGERKIQVRVRERISLFRRKYKSRTGIRRITSATNPLTTSPNKQPSPLSIDVASTKAPTSELKQKEECYCIYEESDDLVAYSGHELLKAGSRVKANASVEFHCAHFNYHYFMGSREITCHKCKPWHRSEYPSCKMPKNDECLVEKIKHGEFKQRVAEAETWDSTIHLTTYGFQTVKIGTWISEGDRLSFSCMYPYSFRGEDVYFTQIECFEGSWKPSPVCQFKKSLRSDHETTFISSTGVRTRYDPITDSIATLPDTQNFPRSINAAFDTESPKAITFKQKQKEECYCLYEGPDDLIAYSGHKLLKAGSRVKANTSVKFHCADFGYHHLMGSRKITCRTCKPWRRSEYPTCVVPENGDAIILFDANQKILPGGIVSIEDDDSQFCCISHGIADYPKWSATGHELVTKEASYQSINKQYFFLHTLSIRNANSKHDGKYTCSVPGKREREFQLRIRKKCKRFEKSDELLIIYSNRRLANSNVRFYCKSNFELEGSKQLTCLSNGEWSGQLPICVPNECPRLAEKSTIRIRYSEEDRAIGSRATFRCVRPRKRKGNYSIKCLPNGTWSGDVPSCTLPDCLVEDIYDDIPVNVVPNLKNVTSSSLPNGFELQLNCKDNLTITEPSRAKCGDEGDWDVPEVSCE